MRDIRAHLQEIYKVEVSLDLISRVTDAVMDDVRDWGKRPLEDVYPIVFLDCMVLKIRENGTVQRRALCARGAGAIGRVVVGARSGRRWVARARWGVAHRMRTPAGICGRCRFGRRARGPRVRRAKAGAS